MFVVAFDPCPFRRKIPVAWPPACQPPPLLHPPEASAAPGPSAQTVPPTLRRLRPPRGLRACSRAPCGLYN